MPSRGIDSLTVAFQPIVNIHSGHCFGHEVLLRGWERLGFASAEALLDACHADGALEAAEAAVRRAAAAVAGRLPDLRERALFVNLDARAGAAWERLAALTAELLGPLCAQTVTEIAAFPDGAEGERRVRALRRHGGTVALDRFGRTADGIALLHGAAPDYVKLDRALVQGLEGDSRKRVVVSQLISMAHTLGAQVVAVGVESGRDLRICREMGCDLVQGFHIQPPAEAPAAAGPFPQIEVLNSAARRRQGDTDWILQQLDTVPAIRVDVSMREVFDRFARAPNTSFIPMVDHAGRPLGILSERKIKNYVYSPFGKDLIANKRLEGRLPDFVVRCPVAEVTTPLDQMLAIFSATDNPDGILVTSQMVYHGFLSAPSLIRALHERSLQRAREENPLTKLPGNAAINDYIATALGGGGAVLAYVDFDNFKPFNDTYGFRQGDRAILLFAELCRKAADAHGWFIGHIGGDDFFVGMREPLAAAQPELAALLGRFASDVESFYPPEARAARRITAADREGAVKSFPLLTASAVLVEVPPGRTALTTDEVSRLIAAHKKEAKASPGRMRAVTAPAGGEPPANL